MKKDKTQNKKRSFRIRYVITGWGIFSSIILAVIVIGAIDISTSGAVRGVVQHEGGKFLQSLERRISWQNHKPVLSDTSDNNYEGADYAIIDRNAHIFIESTLPDDVSIDTLLASAEPSLDFHTTLNHYYARIKPLREKGTHRDSDYLLCAIINYSEINTIYYGIQRFTIIIVLSLLGCMIAASVIVNHLITKHLKSLSEQAEQITKSKDYAMELDTDGPFVEINVLAESYNRLLEQVNKTIQQQLQFNHDVSHELRTPVTVLRAQCQMAREQYADAPDALNSLEVIERQTERMNNLIQRLLDLSRLNRGRLFDHDETVDLEDVIRSICEDIVLVEKNPNRFSLELERISIRANNSLIFTMMRNLIENAIKYSPEHSLITIRIHRQREGAVVQIQDRGIGMSDEIKEKIFDSFYRGDSARTTEGFGLGMTLVKRIADVYHATIEIESKEGEGSTFTILFPKINTESEQKAV